ncbi:UDP-N-acetylglucosamine 2-epimerase (non-hydrolyzing) [Desulfocapsa sp. AH-315-G09]|nr:UDP-N-acetylglucosamine 2-epimerase (non-hydrolyzing) [Desulfocapsa sp.]MBN4065424.1 UDP-N-acetylglucosamine 2-epimerase (non-hydrolyzing) [Desulfocapsa sp. AH-315-G09]
MLKIMSIAGARPNFMKLASIARAIRSHNEKGSTPAVEHIIVHTGQHYDKKMSDSFFIDLNIPQPDINLEVGSGSHASQTADIMQRFEPVLLEQLPDALLVVGDVNSTIACTLVASKIEYPEGHSRRRPIIVHVEAGLRSFDRGMPEEINRILTDAISDILFTTEEQCLTHLQNEGIAKEKVYFTGNVMIDTLMQHVEQAAQSTIKEQLHITGEYTLVTLHRPSNVDRQETLQPLVKCIEEIASTKHIVFPVHPRTFNKMKEFSLLDALEKNPNITLAGPLGYLDFLNLIKDASVVITDSGGIQEETTVLKVPCVTLRENTERPVTVDIGTNYLIGVDPDKIKETVFNIFSGKGKKGAIPPQWDGKTGERILKVILSVH